MEYVTLGKTGLRVSRMGLGGIPIQKIDAEGTKTLLHKLADRGVNYIDTARGYTVSEEYLGYALEGIRDRFIIATKSMARTKEAMAEDIEKSLHNLRTDHIELYQVHNPSMEQLDQVQIGQGAAADERQKRQVRYIIIPHRLPQRGKPAVRAEKIDPHGQKLRVVARLVIQAQPAQHERRCQQQRRAQDVRRFAQHTRAPQQHQREPGLGSQQQTDSDIHGHPSEDTKKRQGDALLPAKNSQIRA